MLPKAQPANRRGFMKLAEATALAESILGRRTAGGEASPPTSTPGRPRFKITKIRIIVTRPDRNGLLVKNLTSEPRITKWATPR